MDYRRYNQRYSLISAKFNGLTTYNHENPPFHEQIELDACLEGMGGVWGNKVYTYSRER